VGAAAVVEPSKVSQVLAGQVGAAPVQQATQQAALVVQTPAAVVLRVVGRLLPVRLAEQAALE
jgi:hypothetical protein